MSSREGGPRFREAQSSDSEDSDSDSHSSESPPSSESEVEPRGVIGPAVIPPEFKHMSTDDAGAGSAAGEAAEEAADYGPALPPGFTATRSVIGPVLPPGFKPPEPPQDMDDDFEDMIGPLPPSADQSEGAGSAAADFERRAQQMKEKLSNPTGVSGAAQRETWMLELPDTMKVGMGLQARTFKQRDSGKQDAAWTDTPADREKREKEAREGGAGATKKRPRDEEPVQSERDKEMEEQVQLLNAKRQKSLYELHQEKLHAQTEKEKKGNKKSRKDKKRKEKKKEKKKKEKEKKKKSKESKEEKKKQEKTERRPFDRDLDLKVNHFDDAMRKHYIKSAQGLGGKFGHSGKGKYL